MPLTPLTLEQVEDVARVGAAFQLPSEARQRIAKGHAALEALLDRGERIYGVNIE